MPIVLVIRSSKILLDKFSKNSLIKSFMKILSVGAQLFHVDGQRDMTKLTFALCNFANAPKNSTWCRHCAVMFRMGLRTNSNFALYNIKSSLFVQPRYSVHCAVRTESLHTTDACHLYRFETRYHRFIIHYKLPTCSLCNLHQWERFVT